MREETDRGVSCQSGRVAFHPIVHTTSIEDIIISIGEELHLDRGMSNVILVSKLNRLENPRERFDEIAQFFETRVSFSQYGRM
jgi:hypothetical protein